MIPKGLKDNNTGINFIIVFNIMLMTFHYYLEPVINQFRSCTVNDCCYTWPADGSARLEEGLSLTLSKSFCFSSPFSPRRWIPLLLPPTPSPRDKPSFFQLRSSICHLKRTLKLRINMISFGEN